MKVVVVVAMTAVVASSTGSPCSEGDGRMSAGDEYCLCDCRKFWNIFRSCNVSTHNRQVDSACAGV